MMPSYSIATKAILLAGLCPSKIIFEDRQLKQWAVSGLCTSNEDSQQQKCRWTHTVIMVRVGHVYPKQTMMNVWDMCDCLDSVYMSGQCGTCKYQKPRTKLSVLLLLLLLLLRDCCQIFTIPSKSSQVRLSKYLPVFLLGTENVMGWVVIVVVVCVNFFGKICNNMCGKIYFYFGLEQKLVW